MPDIIFANTGKVIPLQLIAKYSKVIHDMHDLDTEVNDFEPYDTEEIMGEITEDFTFPLNNEYATSAVMELIIELMKDPLKYDEILTPIVNTYDIICGMYVRRISAVLKILSFLQCPFLLKIIVGRFIAELHTHICMDYLKHPERSGEYIINEDALLKKKMQMFLMTLDAEAVSLYVEKDGTLTFNEYNIEDETYFHKNKRLNGVINEDIIGINDTTSIIIDKMHYEFAYVLFIQNIYVNTIKVRTYIEIEKNRPEHKYDWPRKNLTPTKCTNIPPELYRRCKYLKNHT